MCEPESSTGKAPADQVWAELNMTQTPAEGALEMVACR